MSLGSLPVFVRLHPRANWPVPPSPRPKCPNEIKPPPSGPNLSVTHQVLSTMTQERNEQIFELMRQKLERNRGRGGA